MTTKASMVSDILSALKHLNNPQPDLLDMKSEVTALIASFVPGHMAKWCVRFDFAARELDNLSRRKDVALQGGLFHCTHGFIFEYTTNEGWVLHPDNYLYVDEVAKRLPNDEERARFWALTRSQKRQFISVHLNR